jgi:FtsZ-binding cell division protein ZapB
MENQAQEANQEANVTEQKTVDVSELAKKVEQLEASNARLLDQSKTWKDRYQSLQGTVEKENEAKLTESENWKELVEIEKNKRFELESKVKDLTTRSMQKDLQFKVASLAKDAYNVDDVITSISQRKDLLSIDQETGTISGVEEAYNMVRSEKPYLFNTAKVSGMDTGRPNEMTPKEKTIDEQISEDPNAILADALKSFL